MTASPAAADDDDDDEEFYESLDSILSCSSASDEDVDRHHHSHAGPSSYDVWISEPASVEERRRNLFQRIGLAASLRPEESSSAAPLRARDPSEMDRSVSCDTILHAVPSPSPVSRSLSDGFAGPDPVHKPNPTAEEASHQHDRRHLSSFGYPSPDPSFQSDYEDADGSDEEQGKYTIRNLDNGKEFLVGKDGAWEKLQEDGTGRQLSAEEFEKCVGRSPIVQELMRRQTAQDSGKPSASSGGLTNSGLSSSGAVRAKKRGGWMRGFRNVAGSVVSSGRDLRRRDERDTSSEKGGRRSSSATDDSQDGYHLLLHGPERVNARHCGKSHKELTGLYLSQVIQAHGGSIWCIKFCPEGTYLASAGEDCIIHVWKVLECERREEFSVHDEMAENGNCNPLFAAISTGLSDPITASSSMESNCSEKKRRTKVPSSKKSVSFDHVMVPELVFALSDTPICSFKGHLADVLDLSWSKSLYLLSSSMDKTVRLWHMTSNTCLKTFAHSDYVTCIQFNPIDDRYFISGSLDEKVRIWSIPDRQVVDWSDLYEMVTAVCYTPDGQGALVGSHKGSCHLYDTSENKLQQKKQIHLQKKKKRSSHKKITGFQFAPGSSSEVLITSADSRIRVIAGIDLVHKFKGFRNTSSQISSSLTANGKYVICASEDSHVYMWRYDESQPRRRKGVVMTTHAYENFQCQGVTVAVSWPCIGINSSKRNEPDSIYKACGCGDNCSLLPMDNRCSASAEHGNSLDGITKHPSDRTSATWPEEKLLISNKNVPPFGNLYNFIRPLQSRSAWGLVIVTAGRGGEIKTFQNFGFPVRI